MCQNLADVICERSLIREHFQANLKFSGRETIIWGTKIFRGRQKAYKLAQKEAIFFMKTIKNLVGALKN